MKTTVNITLLFELICSRSFGISRHQIVEKLTQFDVSISEIDRLFRRIHYARAKNPSFSIVLLQKGKWYTFDNREHCNNILSFLLETRIKPTERPSKIPEWIFERWDLSKKVLVESI